MALLHSFVTKPVKVSSVRGERTMRPLDAKLSILEFLYDDNGDGIEVERSLIVDD
jgi:hypothetical protein